MSQTTQLYTFIDITGLETAFNDLGSFGATAIERNDTALTLHLHFDSLEDAVLFSIGYRDYFNDL
jgi:hypothetical protein